MQTHEGQGRAVAPLPAMKPQPSRPWCLLRLPKLPATPRAAFPAGRQAAGMGLGGHSSPKWSGGELGWADMSLSTLSLVHSRSLGSYVSFSLREESLGHSHCCPIPWTPHDNKVRGPGGYPGPGGDSFSLLLPLPLTAHLLSHAGHPNMGGSMQRMNPPRGMGPMGPGPQVTLCVPPLP